MLIMILLVSVLLGIAVLMALLGACGIIKQLHYSVPAQCDEEWFKVGVKS